MKSATPAAATTRHAAAYGVLPKRHATTPNSAPVASSTSG